MIERIINWKIKLLTPNLDLYLILNSGLVAYCSDSELNKLLKGWNIYSVLRYLFDNGMVENLYRKKQDVWNKLDKQKIKTIIYQPMEV